MAKKKSQVSLLQKRSNKAKKKSKNLVNRKKVLAYNQEIARENLPQAAQQLPLPRDVPVTHSAPGNTINPTTPYRIQEPLRNIERVNKYLKRLSLVQPQQPLTIKYEPKQEQTPKTTIFRFSE